MPYTAADDRYEHMRYRRSGRSGLKLPAISLGLWHNFGGDRPLETSRAILRRAFDLGVTHFDLANNYGPPYGSAEETFGRMFARRPPPLPRRARHLDQGRLRHVARPVRRVGLAQVPARVARPVARADGARLRRHLLLAPLRPRDAARGDAGRARHRRAAGQGALRGHLVVLAREHPRGGGDPARRSARRSSSTSRRTRCSTAGSSRSCSTRSASSASAASASRRSPRGCSPTSTSNGIPADSRAAENTSLSPDLLTDETLAKIRALNEIAKRSRPVARPAGARLDAARPADDLDADRRVEQSRSSRTRSARCGTSTSRTTSSRDRPLRDRQRHQPLGALELVAPGSDPGRVRSERCAFS